MLEGIHRHFAVRREAVTISTMGPDMEIVDECTDLPPTTNAQVGGDTDEDGEWDGALIHSVDPDEFPVWRLLWTAQDPYGRHSTARRSHDPMRMLVANDVEEELWALYAHRYGDTFGDQIGHASGGATDPGWVPALTPPDGGALPGHWEGGGADRRWGYTEGGAWLFGWYPCDDAAVLGGGARMAMVYIPAGAKDPLRAGEPGQGHALLRAHEIAAGAAYEGRVQCQRVLAAVWSEIDPSAEQKFLNALATRGPAEVFFAGDELLRGYSLAGTSADAPNCATWVLSILGPVDEVVSPSGLMNPLELDERIRRAHGDGADTLPYLMGIRSGRTSAPTDNVVPPSLGYHRCDDCRRRYRDAIANELARPVPGPLSGLPSTTTFVGEIN